MKEKNDEIKMLMHVRNQKDEMIKELNDTKIA